MTQLSQAKNNIITNEMVLAAEKEPLTKEQLRDSIAKGLVVIPKNIKHDFSPYAVGKGTYIKVNANIGISSKKSSLDEELKKLEVATEAGAHSIMDLSTCNDFNLVREIRREIIKRSKIMLGTVPVYEVATKMFSLEKKINDFTEKDVVEIIKIQAEEGVDFITIHSGVTREVMQKLSASPRVCGIVSRGGSLIAEWIKYNNKENPFYTMFDEILDIAYEYDVTLSLGDGLRPGATNDGTDRAQIAELIILGELVDRARDRGVQVMVEGPGHVKLSDVEMNIKLQKSLCKDAPFYILGPLVTDIAPGYDHITSAIGGAVAGLAGADFLCYVTPAEHLYLPDISDVREGVIASLIAAHSADLALGKGDAPKLDYLMSVARHNIDWDKMAEYAIDKKKVSDAVKKYNLKNANECTMCGEFCSFKRNY
ncbi:MAG: phosphomethylpyrimidine synthase [Spirochaetes bacterium GWD1_27_9]|nr:MAG: phosphomethylpyrimidine synthase [Spirochaetes bacterium GWB1_27_13]OHD24441.1 MAG: phosphomethylpyrimidine synthase [Spirochaetes bacterium GWC1_27_15]OHD36942.1 MAG: phosphomethylpyrimidine synthase [Spirochaetes bacterium GWD1_27_9]